MEIPNFKNLFIRRRDFVNNLVGLLFQLTEQIGTDANRQLKRLSTRIDKHLTISTACDSIQVIELLLTCNRLQPSTLPRKII